MQYLFLTRNGKDGRGHLVRCKAISDALLKFNIKSKFIINSSDDTHIIGVQNIIHIFDWQRNENKLISLIRNYDNIFLDSLTISKRLLTKISNNSKNFIYIDDFKRFKHKKGIIIDWTIGVENKYDQKDLFFLFSHKFAALRPFFWSQNNKVIYKDIKNILVSFSKDINSVALKTVPCVQTVYPNSNIKIVSNSKIIYKKYNHLKNIKILSNISGKKMRNLMLKCDLSVAAGGITLYELASVGVPTIAVITNSNQVDDTIGFARKKIIINSGHWNSKMFQKKLIKSLENTQSYEIRKQMSRKGQKIIDGLGALRIAEFIKTKNKS